MGTHTPATHAYVARTPGCLCVVAATVDRPEYKRDTAKNVADWVRRGEVVERMEIEVVRTLMGEAKCYRGDRLNCAQRAAGMQNPKRTTQESLGL